MEYKFFLSIDPFLNLQRQNRQSQREIYLNIDELPNDWISYDIQRKANELGSPTESTISIISEHMGRDIVRADKKLMDKEVELLEKGLAKLEGIENKDELIKILNKKMTFAQ